MRRNKRHKKYEMYEAIETWQESEMSQTAFCSRTGIALPTFGYWLGKYRKENLAENASKDQTFISVTVPIPGVQNEEACKSSHKIEVHFPNGVRLNCPAGLDIEQLKTLIKF